MGAELRVIRRLDLGYIVRPAAEAGGPEPRVEPVLAYLVRRPEGLLLFDTGIGGGEPETEAHYRPVRRPLPEALAAAGVAVDDIDLVVNCHLHFDHCGGNPLFAGTPSWSRRRSWPPPGAAGTPSTHWSTSPAPSTASSTARPRSGRACGCCPRPATPGATSHC